MEPKYTHLHVHSEHALIDGLIRVKPLISHCVANKIPAVAITDFCNLFSVVKFFKAACQAGVKPIIGAEVTITKGVDEKQNFNLVFLCQNHKGYHNLTKLISKAYVEGQETGSPLVEMDWVTELNEGLILLSGARFGDVGQALLANDDIKAEQCMDHWAKVFKDRFYLELQRTGRPQEETLIQKTLQMAEKKALPVVATNDVRFLQKDDYEAHEARVCIHDGYVLDDQNRPRIYSEQQYFRSPDEMQQLFADIPSAITNTVEIAKRCNVELELYNVHLPAFPTPDGSSIEDYLKTASKQGLEERLQELYDIQQADFSDIRQEYDQRLQFEIDVIIKMGYPGYFLIVADFIRWAKENGIPVGPGRGSGAGSLVAYALKITDLDPLKYDLLFERFLNPERVSMPDFDIDFCMEGRDRVIEYVAKTYGRQSVSQIITFGTMAAKAVVRDVGRVLGYPYGFVDKIAKLIPFEVGMTLDKAFAQEEEFRDRYNQEEEVKTLIDLAKKLEGVARNAGKHAGGVVISPSALTDFSALYCEPGSAQVVTQFDKDDVEAVGLVKFDFLGLRTLTIIDWTLQTINNLRQQAHQDPLDINKIFMEDKASFKLLKACKTTGVFQLESRGMKDLIKRLQPDCFEEIVALVALFRPGPLQSGMVDDFINRKHGRAAIQYPHPQLEPILKPTYGVILYQEQVMQIAQLLAGYTLGGADMLRRAMGKKKPEEMAKQRAIFLEGAVKNNIGQETANTIFDLMEKFAGYGFNKSHSAAYAYVSYQTAWLKTHYPAAFMAAVLTSEMDHTDKIVIFIDECYHLKLNVLAPDINQSQYKFTIADDNTIVYGLGAIKGVGEAVIEIIIQSREQDGPFKDLFDLCARVEGRKVNRRVLEALACSGALDSLGENRASLFASIDNALRYAEQKAKDLESGQNDLFGQGMTADTQTRHEYVQAPIWDDERRLQGEKETLGLYFSGHPLDRYQQELAKFTTSSLDVLVLENNTTVTIAGIVTSVRTMFTKRGDRMAFISVADGKGKMELAVFSDVYGENREIIQKDQILIIEAEINYDENSAMYKSNAKKVFTVEQARAAYSKFIQLKISQEQMELNLIPQLQGILKPFVPGNCPICIEYERNEAKANIHLDEQWWVNPCDKLISALQQELGQEKVKVCY